VPEISVAFGSLHTFLHPSKIADEELSDMSNAVQSEGVLRLDNRYKKTAEITAADRTPYGFGHGKYRTYEQYVVVSKGKSDSKATMYLMDLTASTLEFKKVLFTENELNPSDWFFEQFGTYLYGVNEKDGIGRKNLAPGTDLTGDWSLIKIPQKPQEPPDYVFASPPYDQANWDGSTISAPESTSTSYDSSNDIWTINYSGEGVRTVTISFQVSGVDLRPDWTYRDIYIFDIQAPPGVGIPSSFGIKKGTDTRFAILWKVEDLGNNWFRHWYRGQNIARNNRDKVDALTYEFTTPSGNSTVKIRAPWYGRVWLSLELNISLAENEFPNLQPLRYVYTYYNQETDFESEPSPELVIPGAAQNLLYGDWVTLTGSGAWQDPGVSHFRFYRVLEEGGIKTYYRLATVAITDLSHTDKLSVTEVRALDIFKPSFLPKDKITAITSWQNRLVIAADGIVYISRDSEPLKFEPITGVFDPFDPARGFTFYPDENQSEDILAIVGQDDLYVVTNRSVVAIVGNSPDNWRRVRLPGSEGAVGKRAVAPYNKGVLVLTPSGRLLFHHSSLIQPEEVSEKVRKRSGNDGIAKLATSDALVSVSPENDIEVRSGGNYFILGVDGNWRKGTFTHEVHSTFFVSGLPKRFLGKNGKLYEIGAFDTDDGTNVEWFVQTKKFLLPRVRVQNVFWGDSTKVVDPKDGTKVLYPRLEVITSRGSERVSLRAGKKNVRVSHKSTDWGLMFKIIGNKETIVEECRIDLVKASDARNL